MDIARPNLSRIEKCRCKSVDVVGEVPLGAELKIY